jgi:hypothetical protein
MQIKKWLQLTADYGYKSMMSGLDVAGTGMGYLTKLVGDLRLFASTNASNADATFDERHYFLVPDPRSHEGYSLVLTRTLPDGVPPINELPKRRYLHLANLDSEVMLRTLLVKQAQAEELEKPTTGKPLSVRVREIADAIDALDERVFGGVLLIGGLVALFNPLAGAAIAAKSLLPSFGLFASKYGLRMAEESLNEAEMRNRVKIAEQDVRKQFGSSETVAYTNQLLSILDTAVRTNESEFDPVLALHDLLASDLSQEQHRMIRLAKSAILNVYDNVIRTEQAIKQAGLGPDDIRFLRLLKQIESE